MNTLRFAFAFALLVAPSTFLPSQAKSVRPKMYGQWGLMCLAREDANHSLDCTIRFQPNSEDVGWAVELKSGGNSKIVSWGRNKATCRPATVIQQADHRAYRLTAPNVTAAEMKVFADRLLIDIGSPLEFFWDCYNETGRPQPYPAKLLQDNAANFTLALIAAENILRERALRDEKSQGRR